MATKGRKPTPIKDPKVELLLQALRNGNYVEHACDYAGLNKSTVWRWVERGRAERERVENGLAPDTKEQHFVELCNLIEKARADAIVANVAIIQQAARDGTWQASAWWLERTLPQQYGRQLKAEVTTSEVSSDSDADIQRIIAYLDEVDSRLALEMGEGTSQTGTATPE